YEGIYRDEFKCRITPHPDLHSHGKYALLAPDPRDDHRRPRLTVGRLLRHHANTSLTACPTRLAHTSPTPLQVPLRPAPAAAPRPNHALDINQIRLGRRPLPGTYLFFSAMV